MARQERRKTSLGNLLDDREGTASSSIISKDYGRSTPTRPALGSSERWRSASDASHAPVSRTKLFGSVREAMEFEAQEEEEERQALNDTDVRTTSAVLDARTLSSLEQTQADEAGYTVIRRRAVSDLRESRDQRTRSSTGRRAVTHQQDRRHQQQHQHHQQQRGGQPTRGKRSDSTSSSGRAHPQSATNTNTTNIGGRQRGKRSPQPKQEASPREPRKPADTTTSMAFTSPSASQDAGVSSIPNPPGEDTSDAQRWLAAASAGAVLPVAPLLSPPASAAMAGWSASISAWPPAMASATVPTEDTGEKDPSQPHGDNAVDLSAAESATEALHGSMLSWLESSLSLDETRAPSSL